MLPHACEHQNGNGMPPAGRTRVHICPDLGREDLKIGHLFWKRVEGCSASRGRPSAQEATSCTLNIALTHIGILLIPKATTPKLDKNTMMIKPSVHPSSPATCRNALFIPTVVSSPSALGSNRESLRPRASRSALASGLENPAPDTALFIP